MDGMGIYPVYPVPPPSAQISSLPQEKWAIFRRPEFQTFMTVTGILGPGGVRSNLCINSNSTGGRPFVFVILKNCLQKISNGRTVPERTPTKTLSI